MTDDHLAASTVLAEALWRRWKAEENLARICSLITAKFPSRADIRIITRGHEAAPMVATAEVLRWSDDYLAVQRHDVGAEYSWKHRVRMARKERS